MSAACEQIKTLSFEHFIIRSLSEEHKEASIQDTRQSF